MKVRVWCLTHDLGSDVEDVYEDIPDDYEPEDLKRMAEDLFWNEKQPEWGYEILDGKRRGEEG